MTETTKVTPDQQLAELISKTLVDAALVAADKQSKLTEEMATGQINSEDWRLYIESAITPEEND